MAFIKIACCRAVFHFSYSLMPPPPHTQLPAPRGKAICLAGRNEVSGPNCQTPFTLPCHYQHLEMVNKPQVSRHTTGRQSVHPAETSCRPCCVQVTALPPAACLHLRSLASCFSYSRVVTTFLANPMTVYGHFLPQNIFRQTK